MRWLVPLFALLGAASADPKPDCGAPCEQARRFEREPALDYKKAADLYRAACKADESGPMEACRRLAIAGVLTRGHALTRQQASAMLARTCKRGDVPSCSWKTRIDSEWRAEPGKLSEAIAPCTAGDLAACEPLMSSIASVVAARKTCDPAWWTLATEACERGSVEACITYRKMSSAEHTCKRPATVKWDTEQISAVVEKLCHDGDPDACGELMPNDDRLWARRSKAHEKFACDAIRP